MKLSNRLKTIADMVKTKSVIDVGCDHGLLDVYLAKEKHISCIASDISENALNQAKENIHKYQVQSLVKTICTNGLQGIKVSKEDTVILSGMGTHTIIDILNKRDDIKYCIISAHTDVPYLRRWMTSHGYVISAEQIVEEKNILYIVISFEEGQASYQEIDYVVGPYLKYNQTYLKQLLAQEKTLLQKIPITHKIKRQEKEKLISMLLEAIKKAN